MASYERALDQGANAIQCGIRLSRDGELVVMRDGKVDRGATDTGVVKLEDLLQLVRRYPRPVKLFVQTRPTRHGGRVEKKLGELLNRLRMASPTSAEDCRAVVISYLPDSLSRMRKAAPGVPRVLLLNSKQSIYTVNLAKLAGATAIGHHLLQLHARPELVAEAAAAGFGVLGHGLDRFGKGSVAAEGTAAEFCDTIGVDAVITNEPGWVAHVLRPELADTDLEAESDDGDAGERWRAVPAGIDSNGQLARHALAMWSPPLTPRTVEKLLDNPRGTAAENVEQTQADARVWRMLTGHQQRALIDNYSEFVGNRMGVPIAARHEANSVYLAAPPR